MTLQELRESKLMSVPELAKLTGIGTNSIYRWERGDNIPNMRNRRRLVKALGEEVLKCFK